MELPQSTLNHNYDEIAEKSVLACCMMSLPAAHQAIEFGVGQMFYDYRHREIFKIIESQVGEDITPDLVTIAGKVSDSIEKYYLTSILEFYVSDENISYWLDVLKQKHILRKSVEACTEFIASCSSECDVEKNISNLQQQLCDINSETSKALTHIDLIKKVSDICQDIFSNKDGASTTGIKTGFKNLDAMFVGLDAGDLLIIAGRPSVGKSALALNILENVSLGGTPTRFFSCEMKTEHLVFRTASNLSGLPLTRIRNGELSETECARLTNVLGRIGKLPLRYEDSTTTLTVQQLVSKARRIHAKEKFDLCVVDYIQLIDSAKKHGTKAEEVAEVSKSLKRLALELNIPVIALAQLNRSMEKEKRRPRSSDLKESGSLEQDADKIILLYVEDETGNYCGDVEVTAIVDKNRFGARGDVPLLFRRSISRFETYIPKII